MKQDTTAIDSTFTQKLIAWQKQHGRHNLPWQVSDPYCVWLSEIMLQQTQVITVLDYYPRFIERFADVASLAEAHEDDVLALWSGLGYYSRARNLHKAAKQIMSDYKGVFPATRSELETLCGVGRTTAAAICAFAFGKQEAILDGNVKRVLCRVFTLDGEPMDKQFEQILWDKAESLLPKANQMQSYTQGLMDLGATVCIRSNPKCPICPMQTLCQAKAQGIITQLPRKKQQKITPTKTLYWLFIKNAQGELLVEKRPAQGIWASLYCVPSFETLKEAENFLQSLNLSLEEFEQQEEFTHRLTHFLLLITPFYINLTDKTSNNLLKWSHPKDLINKAVPKPLFKKIKPISIVNRR